MCSAFLGQFNRVKGKKTHQIEKSSLETRLICVLVGDKILTLDDSAVMMSDNILSTIVRK